MIRKTDEKKKNIRCYVFIYEMYMQRFCLLKWRYVVTFGPLCNEYEKLKNDEMVFQICLHILW